MLLLANSPLTDKDQDWVKVDADERAYFIFGKSMDFKLINLIPECDSMEKGSSICMDCKFAGSFFVYGRILCRQCRQNRKNSLEDFKPIATKRRREQENSDSAEGLSVKKLNEDCLNLSLEDDKPKSPSIARQTATESDKESNKENDPEMQENTENCKGKNDY